jgi:hypothetical protein
LSVDPITLTIGVAAGAGAGLAISYFGFSKRGGTKVKVAQRDESGQMRRKTVTAEELEASRREMRTVMLERDLLSAALTKVYEAESEGQITKEEREMIARRYSSQIRDMDSKLRDKELLVEVGELERLRDELLTLFREKIQNIETRLDQAKERMPPRPEVKPEGKQVQARQVAPAEELEKAVERRTARKEETEGERRVSALREEVMEALTKLEQIDSKKENETA